MPGRLRHLNNLTRLRTNSWARLGLVALALGFCVYGLAAQRAQVTAAVAHLHWYSVAPRSAAP